MEGGFDGIRGVGKLQADGLQGGELGHDFASFQRRHVGAGLRGFGRGPSNLAFDGGCSHLVIQKPLHLLTMGPTLYLDPSVRFYILSTLYFNC